MLTEMWEKILNKKSGSQGGADGVVGGAELRPEAELQR